MTLRSAAAEEGVAELLSRLQIIALSVFVVAGCSQRPQPPCVPLNFPSDAGPPGFISGVIGLTGQPVSVELDFAATVYGCDGGFELPSRIDVDVAQGFDRHVSAVAAPATLSAGRIGTTVTFTPETAGTYHLTVRFEPGLATVLDDIVVAADKTNVPPVVVSLPALSGTHTCQQIAVDGDTLLCLDADLSTGIPFLRSIRAATEVDSVPAEAFAFSAPNVWTASATNQNVQLYLLGADGHLTARGSVALGINGLPQVIARGERALLLDSHSFFEVDHLSDGGFTASTATSLAGQGAGQWVPDVGLVYANGYHQVCGFSMLGGQASDAGCPQSGVEVVGFDDDGIWSSVAAPFGASDNRTLFLTTWQPGQVSPVIHSLTNVAAGSPGFQYGEGISQISPLLYGASNTLYLPSFDGEALTLARYPFTSGILHADSQRLWFQTGNTITWYPR